MNCSQTVHFYYHAKGLCNYFIQFRSFLISSKYLKKIICPNTFYVADGKTQNNNTQWLENITNFYDINELKKYYDNITIDDDENNENICSYCFEQKSIIKRKKRSYIY